MSVRSISTIAVRPAAKISGTSGIVNGFDIAQMMSAAVIAMAINMLYFDFSTSSACARNACAWPCAAAMKSVPIVPRLLAKSTKFFCTSPPTFSATRPAIWLKPVPASATRRATSSHSSASARMASSSPCGQASPAMM
ncbi:hypothetical protein ACQPXB_47600 [Amycolatopsis sp. CA-161197]|uniref:hypothetical protein n=1 Tax=Amycolatopsis sp. CA-161197 TaxID=3239922 RepID=UPI003D935426